MRRWCGAVKKLLLSKLILAYSTLEVGDLRTSVQLAPKSAWEGDSSDKVGRVSEWC